MTEDDINRAINDIQTAIRENRPEAALYSALTLIGSFVVDAKRIADTNEQIANSLAALERRPL